MPVLGRLSDRIDVCSRALFLGLLLLVAQSLLWAEGVPVGMKLAGVAVAGVAFVRPAEALLVVVGLAPLGVMFSSLWHSPARGSEALVLAFLAGWFLRTWRPTNDQPRPADKLSTPMLLFGAVVAASCFEQLAWLQVQRDYPWPFVQGLSVFLARDYLLGPGGFGFVQTAIRLLEGLALFVCVTTICHDDRTFAPRLIRMLVGAAIGAALLSLANVH